MTAARAEDFTRAEDLRAAFDHAFTLPIAAALPQIDVIAIVAGGQPCAFAQAAIAAIHTDLHVVVVPSPAPALCGVATFRGNVIAVWDLGLILHGTPTSHVRWCAVLRDEALAVAFDRLDGRVRVASLAGATVELTGTIYPLIDLAGAVAGAQGARHGR